MGARWGAGVVTLAAVLAATPVAARPAVPRILPAQAGTTPTQQATPPKRHHAKGDPLEGFNRAMFAVHTTLDRLFFRPLAKAYEKIVPKVVRKGLRHFFSNLGEPLVFANDVLQLKPKRALKTFARFTINSTIGVAGTLDVAKGEDRGLEHHDNSFGNTLGRYGIGPGPYLFFPLVGPGTLRDTVAGLAEGQVLPLAVGNPFDRAEYRVPRGVITGLDLRAEADGAYNALIGSAVDPYATLRSAYLQDRAGTVAELRGGGATSATSPLDDPLVDPAGVGGTGQATPSNPLDDPLTDPATKPPLPATPAVTP